MICRSVEALRRIARLILTIGVIPFALSACSDRSDPGPPSPDPAALHQPSEEFAALQASSADLAMAIQAQIDGRDAVLGTLTPAERTELHALYGPGGYSPLWLDAAGRPSRNARDALALLKAAADEGLDPGDYYQALLDHLTTALEAESPPAPDDVATFDVTLSSGTLRYLRHLHSGRVDPRRIGFRLSAPADHHDFAAVLARRAREPSSGRDGCGREAAVRAVPGTAHDAGAIPCARRGRRARVPAVGRRDRAPGGGVSRSWHPVPSAHGIRRSPSRRGGSSRPGTIRRRCSWKG